MMAAQGRRELIEKKVAMMQAGYLLGNFKSRILQEPASLARRLVQAGFIDALRRLETELMIRNDLYEMLEELADLPEKTVAPLDDINDDHHGPVRDHVPDQDLVDESEEGSVATRAELKADRTKRRRQKMRQARRARDKNQIVPQVRFDPRQAGPQRLWRILQSL
jgi:hypothetical protein